MSEIWPKLLGHRQHSPGRTSRRRFVTFDWTTRREEAFQELKRLLTTAPILRHPDLSKPFFLWTDASEAGLGAVLEQEGESGERPYSRW